STARTHWGANRKSVRWNLENRPTSFWWIRISSPSAMKAIRKKSVTPKCSRHGLWARKCIPLRSDNFFNVQNQNEPSNHMVVDLLPRPAAGASWCHEETHSDQGCGPRGI